jgi:hypothetical protein
VRFGLRNQMIRLREENVSHSIETDFAAYPFSQNGIFRYLLCACMCVWGGGGWLERRMEVLGMGLTTYPNLVPMLTVRGAFPSLPHSSVA